MHIFKHGFAVAKVQISSRIFRVAGAAVDTPVIGVSADLTSILLGRKANLVAPSTNAIPPISIALAVLSVLFNLCCGSSVVESRRVKARISVETISNAMKTLVVRYSTRVQRFHFDEDFSLLFHNIC